MGPGDPDLRGGAGALRRSRPRNPHPPRSRGREGAPEVIRTSLVFLAASLASCGGGGGFQRPDYAGEARALCDQAEATADTNRALSLYGMALNADPRHARAYLGRARIFERTGRAAEAERSYSMAVDSADDDVRSLYLMERARYM